MSLTIIFITLIVCTVVIVLTILIKSSDQHDKSEIDSLNMHCPNASEPFSKPYLPLT